MTRQALDDHSLVLLPEIEPLRSSHTRGLVQARRRACRRCLQRARSSRRRGAAVPLSGRLRTTCADPSAPAARSSASPRTRSASASRSAARSARAARCSCRARRHTGIRRRTTRPRPAAAVVGASSTNGRSCGLGSTGGDEMSNGMSRRWSRRVPTWPQQRGPPILMSSPAGAQVDDDLRGREDHVMLSSELGQVAVLDNFQARRLHELLGGVAEVAQVPPVVRNLHEGLRPSARRTARWPSSGPGTPAGCLPSRSMHRAAPGTFSGTDAGTAGAVLQGARRTRRRAGTPSSGRPSTAAPQTLRPDPVGGGGRRQSLGLHQASRQRQRDQHAVCFTFGSFRRRA